MKEAAIYQPVGILQKEDFIFFAPADIVYIEARHNNCVIYMVSRAGGFTVTASMNELADILPQSMFCRIHKSYIISLLHIGTMNRQKTRLSYLNNKVLPIGEFFQQRFLEKLLLIT